MNIYYTDEDPIIAARNVDNKRLQIQIMEAVKILSYLLESKGIATEYGMYARGSGYCSELIPNKANYTWILNYLKAACKEYTFRHRNNCTYYNSVVFFESNRSVFTDKNKIVELPNFTEFKDDNIITAYRKHLLNKWANAEYAPKWSGTRNRRKPPEWALELAWLVLFDKHNIDRNY